MHIIYLHKHDFNVFIIAAIDEKNYEKITEKLTRLVLLVGKTEVFVFFKNWFVLSPTHFHKLILLAVCAEFAVVIVVFLGGGNGMPGKIDKLKQLN